MSTTKVKFDQIRHMDRAIAAQVCAWCGQGKTHRRLVLPDNRGWVPAHVGGCAREYWNAYAYLDESDGGVSR